MEQRSLFDDEAAPRLAAPLPCPYSMRFPHKQARRGYAIRRLYDRRHIDDAMAVELLKPISKMNEGCWAKPFSPSAVLDLWRPHRPKPVTQ